MFDESNNVNLEFSLIFFTMVIFWDNAGKAITSAYKYKKKRFSIYGLTDFLWHIFSFAYFL